MLEPAGSADAQYLPDRAQGGGQFASEARVRIYHGDYTCRSPSACLCPPFIACYIDMHETLVACSYFVFLPLTLRPGCVGHRWEEFTDAIVGELKKRTDIVYLLWGKPAYAK